MEVDVHNAGNAAILELKRGSMRIDSVEDALDLMALGYTHKAKAQIIHSQDLHPDFFDLKTGFAGELLQKYSTYGNKLAVIGDFSELKSKSLRDFVYESNKTGHVVFTENTLEAITLLS